MPGGFSNWLIRLNTSPQLAVGEFVTAFSGFFSEAPALFFYWDVTDLQRSVSFGVQQNDWVFVCVLRCFTAVPPSHPPHT